MVLKGQTHSLSLQQIHLILCCPLPQTIKKLTSFLGVTGFYSILILGHAALARPLYKLLKDAKWDCQYLLEWDPKSTKALQTLNSHSKQPWH
jgi:hypothetical protein